MIKNKLIIFCFFFIFISTYLYCENSNKYDEIKYFEYKFEKLITETKGFKLDSTLDKYNKLIRYYTEDTSLNFFVKVNERNDSSILYNGRHIMKLTEKYFNYNGKNEKIIKYEYNIPDSQDEEAYIFVNSKYEVVCVNYYVWGISIFIETKGMSGSYKTILLDERNRHFFYFIPK